MNEMADAGAANWGRNFLSMISDLICVCRGGDIAFINDTGAAILGVTTGEAVGKPIADFVHEEFKDLFAGSLADLAAETEPFPMMFKAADGTGRDVEVQVRMLDADAQGQAAVIYARDVTERTRAAENLVRSEERYRRLVEQALDLICICRGAEITFINAAGVKMLGGSGAETYIGKPLSAIAHSDYSEIVEEGLADLAGEEGPLPLKLVREDGAVIDVETAVMPFGDAGAFMMEARDISEQKRSAEALREREAKLRGIMDSVGEAIITANEKGIIQSFNPAAERIFGYTAREAIGQNLSMLMPEPHSVNHDHYLTSYMNTGEAKILGSGRELEGKRKDGSVFPLELNVTELRHGTQRIFTGVLHDITERKQAEEAEKRHKAELEHRVEERTRDLKRLSKQTEMILHSAQEGIIGTDQMGRISFTNNAAAQLLGWTADDIVGEKAREIMCVDPEGGRWLAGDGTEGIGHTLFKRKDGTNFDVEYSSSLMEDGEEIHGAVIVFRDVTERKRAEEKLRLAGTVFETASEGIIVCDAHQSVTAINPAFVEVTGYHADQVVGGPPYFLSADDEGGQIIEKMWKDIGGDGEHWEGDLWSARADGEEYAIHLSVTGLFDADDQLVQYVLMVTDITERKRDEERIRYQANYDTLTGLPNRSLFMDRLTQSVMSASRTADARVGLMFIDLDGFKQVNDTMGHDMGDFLLKGAAERISQCVREYDTVARLGGDEFTVVMPNLDVSRSAAIVGQRILDSLGEPFIDGDNVAHVSGSIGIAVYPEDAPDTETLLKNADAAMYRAKKAGKANYQFFTADLNQEVTERASIKDNLAGALERGELALYYQPRIEIATGAVTGAEALLRWNNPDLGLVEPNRFISVMEEAGLMDSVGVWVLETAMKQQKAWADAGVKHPNVSVNLSVRQLRKPGFSNQVKELLHATGADPRHIEFEIVEDMLIKDPESCVLVLMELRAQGIRVTMDDFGTGYSSLSYLRRFPVQQVKIDNSFIEGVAHGDDDTEIVSSIVNMVHGLGRRVIAEGVETIEQLDVLAGMGCDEAHGFLFRDPEPADDVTLFMLKGQWERD